MEGLLVAGAGAHCCVACATDDLRSAARQVVKVLSAQLDGAAELEMCAALQLTPADADENAHMLVQASPHQMQLAVEDDARVIQQAPGTFRAILMPRSAGVESSSVSQQWSGSSNMCGSCCCVAALLLQVQRDRGRIPAAVERGH